MIEIFISFTRLWASTCMLRVVLKGFSLLSRPQRPTVRIKAEGPRGLQSSWRWTLEGQQTKPFCPFVR